MNKLFFISMLLFSSLCSAANDRVALVIGNSAYKNAPLDNPINDATDVTAKLKMLGFTVITKNNLTSKQIGPALREFRNKLSPGSTAVFYYAGHGVQIRVKTIFLQLTPKFILKMMSPIKVYQCVRS